MRYRMLASDHETTDIRHHHLVPDIDGSADGVSVLIKIVKLGHRGIVVEDIQPAEMTDCLADQRLYGVRVSGIEAQSDCIAADLVRRRLCCFLDEVGANHLYAFRSETLSRCRSDASAPTCDDRQSFLKSLPDRKST